MLRKLKSMVKKPEKVDSVMVSAGAPEVTAVSKSAPVDLSARHLKRRKRADRRAARKAAARAK